MFQKFSKKKKINKNELNHKLKLINNSTQFTGYCWAFIINKKFYLVIIFVF